MSQARVAEVIHLPIGLVQGSTFSSVCLVCLKDIVTFDQLDGSPEFVYLERQPGTDSGPTWRWDQLGRMDGWAALAPHACPAWKERPR